MRHSIANSVKTRILRHGPGWVFSAYNFVDLGSDSGVRTALSRLQEEKIIRRVAQGIYDYPKKHHALGPLSPSVDDVARVYAEKNAAKIQATGAYAANLLGLSDQVPGRVSKNLCAKYDSGRHKGSSRYPSAQVHEETYRRYDVEKDKNPSKCVESKRI